MHLVFSCSVDLPVASQFKVVKHEEAKLTNRSTSKRDEVYSNIPPANGKTGSAKAQRLKFDQLIAQQKISRTITFVSLDFSLYMFGFLRKFSSFSVFLLLLYCKILGILLELVFWPFTILLLCHSFFLSFI